MLLHLTLLAFFIVFILNSSIFSVALDSGCDFPHELSLKAYIIKNTYLVNVFEQTLPLRLISASAIDSALLERVRC